MLTVPEALDDDPDDDYVENLARMGRDHYEQGSAAEREVVDGDRRIPRHLLMNIDDDSNNGGLRMILRDPDLDPHETLRYLGEQLVSDVGYGAVDRH